MMIRSNKKRKFSIKYRIEKWFYEDSVKCIIGCFRGLFSMVLCGALLGLVALLPALFH